MNTIARRFLILAGTCGCLMLAPVASAQVTTGTVVGHDQRRPGWRGARRDDRVDQ